MIVASPAKNCLSSSLDISWTSEVLKKYVIIGTSREYNG